MNIVLFQRCKEALELVATLLILLQNRNVFEAKKPKTYFKMLQVLNILKAVQIFFGMATLMIWECTNELLSAAITKLVDN